MKHEKAFSMGGFYTFVLDSNMMLHNQVAESGSLAIENWLATAPARPVVRLLDLACGGEPVSVHRMMAHFPATNFEYTGVDLNPDQITKAREFKFSENVSKVHLIEGNAWDVSELLRGGQLAGPFDIVFSGMNLHHGTPEEIYCLLLQLKPLLAPGGLFMNHDFYRPEQSSYLRRPPFNPANPSESFAMVPVETLCASGKCPVAVAEANAADNDWRLPFVDKYRLSLRHLGAEEQGIDQVMDHVLTRDYPVSLSEMRKLCAAAGFTLQQLKLNSEKEPLGEYFLMVEGKVKQSA